MPQLLIPLLTRSWFAATPCAHGEIRANCRARLPSWWLCLSILYFERLLSLSNYLVLHLNPWHIFVSLLRYSPGLQEALHKPNPPHGTLPPCPWKEEQRIKGREFSAKSRGLSLTRLMSAFTMAKQSQGTMNNSCPLTDTRAVAHLCHLARRGELMGGQKSGGEGRRCHQLQAKDEGGEGD